MFGLKTTVKNRKKKDDDENILPVSSSSPKAGMKKKDGDDEEEEDEKYSMAWNIFLFALSFYLLFDPIMAAFRHTSPDQAKFVDDQLASLAKGFAAQRTLLATQLEELSKRLKNVEAEGFLQEEAEANASLRGTAAAAAPASTGNAAASNNNNNPNAAAPAVPNAPSAVTSATAAKVQELKQEIQAKTTELKQHDDIEARFCGNCVFRYGGLRTGCGERAAFLMKRHGTNPKEAMEAVAAWSPSCVNN